MGSFGSVSATTGFALTSSFLAGFASSSELESSEPELDELEELAAAFFFLGASDSDESESLPLEEELSAFFYFLPADFFEEALLTTEFFLAGLASEDELLSEESEESLLSLSLSTTFFFFDFSFDIFLFLTELSEALELALALLAGTFGASLELLLLSESLELSSELSEASAASLAASSAAFLAASALALASSFFAFLSVYKWSTIVRSEKIMAVALCQTSKENVSCTKKSLSKLLHVFLRKNGSCLHHDGARKWRQRENATYLVFSHG